MDEARRLLERTLQLEQENRELRRKEVMLRKLALAVEHSPISVLISDRTGVIEYVNPKFCEVTGYSPQEAIGNTPRILKSGTHPAQFYRDLWATILSGREWRGEFHNRNKDGSLIWELASISPVFDEYRSITHFVGVKEDISELKRLQKELGEMAHSDDLTGLPNRALFMDRLGQVMIYAHRNLSRFALLFIDLDGFKVVNDRYGHQAGDEVLQEAARRLMGCVRKTDTVARIGGDEFIIILSDLKHWEEPAVVARKLLEVFGSPFRTGEVLCRIGVSIGVSIYPDDAAEAPNLISCADSAMYAAKEAGKNCYRYWSQLSGKPGGFRTP
jgi:diguanylate cyclase (GGDEF)-like protein/PAS domain S-box-containing protein